MAVKLFTRAEVAKHGQDAFETEQKNPLIILHNRVYAVTDWLNDHPGGHEILLQNAGTDATMNFEDQYHSSAARARRNKFYVGDLVPEEQKLCVCPTTTGGIRMVYFDHSFTDQQKKSLRVRLEEYKKEAGISADKWSDYKLEIISALEEKLENDLDVTHSAESYPLQVKIEPAKGGSSDDGVSPLLKAVLAAALVLYVRKAMNSPPIPAVTYSKNLRHAHLGMAVGTFVGIGSVQVATRSDGATKRNYMLIHKSSGVLMLLAILVRIKLRLSSVIPENFPGPAKLQLAERVSHKLLYAIMLALPASGAIYGYFSGAGLPLFGTKTSPSDEDLQTANKAIDFHRSLGRFMEYMWLPFHLALSAYHQSNGRNVVRRISPFL
jgi:cytochrome b561